MHTCDLEVCHNLTRNQRFCSRSCSTTWANLNNPKRPRKGVCECGAAIVSGRKRCPPCAKEYRNRPRVRETATLRDFQGSVGAYNTRVRSDARKVMDSLGMKRRCWACGYDKHVEVCHKKDIRTFSPDDLIRVINHPSNLLLLCPNHHWEFDNYHAITYADPQTRTRIEIRKRRDG